MITDQLERWAAEKPDATFLITDDRSYSYREMLSSARRLAGQLQARNVCPGDHVAVLADNSAAYVASWFGINLAGAIAATLNNQLVSDGLRYAVEQSGAKLILADGAWIDGKSHHLSGHSAEIPILRMERDVTFFAAVQGAPEADIVRLPRGAISAIIYTSGSTGFPKGVMNSHGVYEAVGRASADMVGLGPDDVIMAVLPMFHANTQMFGVMPVLTVGAKLALRQRFSASQFFKDAKRFGATGYPAVGTIISILLSRFPEPQRDHAMRFVIGGGVSGTSETTRIMEEHRSRFGITIYEAFGSSETGGWCTGNTVANYRAGSNGRPRADMEVKIFDELDDEIAQGQEGEIVVRPRVSNVMFSGYWGKAEETVKASRNFWFHTGDRGRFDADGYLYFTGRYKELIRKKGEMISPVEIESKLLALPGVRECAAVPIPDPVLGEEIKICLVSHDGVTAADIRHYLSQHFPAYMLPRYVEFLDEIPKTETQKVDRLKLGGLGPNVHDLGA